jgi:hypothetical protein
MKKTKKPNGDCVYDYVLCYVDDILYGGVDSQAFMDRLSIVYKLKDGSVKEPTTYLGADICWMDVGGDSEYTYAYGMSSDTYLKRAVQEVESELQMAGMQLKSKVVSPMVSGYRPGLDSSPSLNPERASYYMSLMGILRWAI